MPAVRRGHVRGQAPEPGLERPLGVVAVEVPVQADEDLLGQVLGLVGVAQVLIGERVDPPLVLADQGLERVQVAPSGGAGQPVDVRVVRGLRAKGRQGLVSLHRQELHARRALGCCTRC